MKSARISISEAKARLLRIVRDVERGKPYEITRDGKVVAQLVPAAESRGLGLVGFAKAKVAGDATEPVVDERDWTFDAGNLR